MHAGTDAPLLTVFDIERFAVHDGPGIRTVVFLKGCPLRCAWCQNPESLSFSPVIAFFPERCRGCNECLSVCPKGAIRGGPERILRSLCNACGLCAEACPHEALRLVGRKISTRQICELLLQDSGFYDASSGGVTLSGGEPLLAFGPVSDLLARCKSHGLHTTVQTCGAVPWKNMAGVASWVDLFYFDLKAHGEALHQRCTGHAMEPILANARRAVENGYDVCFRMPVVPTFNDTKESIVGTARTLRKLGHETIRLLPYHGAYTAKIPRIGGNRPILRISSEQAAAAMEAASRLFADEGIRSIVEGDDAPIQTPASKGSAASRAVDLPEQPDLTGRPDPSGQPDLEPFSIRVYRLREAVQSFKPAVCTERASLVTGYFKDPANRGKPVIVQKAEALRNLLLRRSVTIHPEELLVGNFTSKRVGGSLFCELHGVAVLEDLFAFSRRELNPLAITRKEQAELLFSVLPFWITRFLALKAFPLHKALLFILGQLEGKRYLINETGGISHFVPDYPRLLALGASGMSRLARSLGRTAEDPAKEAFYKAVEIVSAGLGAMGDRYARKAAELASTEPGQDRRDELLRIADVCRRVPRLPARTFHEALQSILFAQTALNLESLDNSVSPGRLDQVLFPYYEADCNAGRLSISEAAELVGCFTVKMSEIVPVFSRRITRFHGGMFNGQVVCVGGVDREGKDATNDLTYLFCEAMDRLRMRQPNYHARIHAQSPPAYVHRVAKMLRDGSGAPSLMNDEVVVEMLTKRGTTIEDARDYSPVGCVEPVASGSSFCSTDAALFNLALPLERALGLKPGGPEGASGSSYGSTEQLVAAFEAHVVYLVDELVFALGAVERANAAFHPTPLTSMLIKGCLETGIDASAGGSRYNGSGVQAVGVVDVADSLAAVEEVVFRRRLVPFELLVRALESSFSGYESLRGHLIKAPKFGNGHPLPDGFARRVAWIFTDALSGHRNTRNGPYRAGFYSVTAHAAFGSHTGALPSGRLASEVLANGLTPANGMDRNGPTASLGSVAGLGLSDLARNGMNLNLTLDGSWLSGERGIDALSGLVRGYFASKGMQVQMNVLDGSVLAEAMLHPETHPNLLVRVSGYSAYFNDLSPEMKLEMIRRQNHGRSCSSV